ncbi:DUF5655 domain-containing protein [Georgenia subflava]|uniref:DUF5655 domain-containing protein n=1 Tax=Georgenia subflava TaxID=1622177 RepID=UPI001D011A7D|nr:DUF5655 domain-containing protein [Georgenia subflava]
MSAQVWTVEDHLREQPEEHVALYRRLESVIRSFGEVSLSVSKSTITFKGSRRGFAGGRPTRHGVEGYFDLTRPLTGDARIRRVTPYQRNLHVHHYRLREDADLDETFAGWLREAYDVGCGAHLRT